VLRPLVFRWRDIWPAGGGDGTSNDLANVGRMAHLWPLKPGFLILEKAWRWPCFGNIVAAIPQWLRSAAFGGDRRHQGGWSGARGMPFSFTTQRRGPPGGSPHRPTCVQLGERDLVSGRFWDRQRVASGGTPGAWARPDLQSDLACLPRAGAAGEGLAVHALRELPAVARQRDH